MFIRIWICGLLLLQAVLATAAEVKVSTALWAQFSPAEQATLLERFPQLTLARPESLGIIAGSQTANRSTPGSNAGAALGGALGGAAYIDSAFRGNNSNYSAVSQLGAMLLGAAAGSMLDGKPQARFEFNYSVQTLDGQIREQRQNSGDEFAKPLGQCVELPLLNALAPASCSADKVSLLSALAMVSGVAASRVAEPPKSSLCRIPGIGVMTINAETCADLNGVQE